MQQELGLSLLSGVTRCGMCGSIESILYNNKDLAGIRS